MADHMPKISIITPSYNQGRFIEETISSVLGQNYGNLEFIIIDGGSTDNSVDIIRRYADRLAYWVSEKDRGQTHAINKGFERATGDVITWLNSDDLYCDGTLAKVGAYFAEHPDCMWLCGNILFMDEDGGGINRKRPLYSPFILRYGNASVYQPNIFLRRTLLDEVGFPREDFHTIMDQEWFCRVAERHAPHIIDQDFAKFRWHKDSKSSSQKDTPHYRRYIQERTMVSERYLPRLAWFFRTAPQATLFVLTQAARLAKMALRLRAKLGGGHAA